MTFFKSHTIYMTFKEKNKKVLFDHFFLIILKMREDVCHATSSEISNI